MPLLVSQVEPPPEPPPPPDPTPHDVIQTTWTSPDGQVVEIACRRRSGVWMLRGAIGLYAGPRAVTSHDVATGGAYGRWSHAGARLISLPIGIQAGTALELVDRRRDLVRAMTATTPVAGVPRPGVLRITRADGSWREVHAVYLDGLGGQDEGRYLNRVHTTVLSLRCDDPWWYGESQVALNFGVEIHRDYLDPYETVSPSTRLGTTTIDVVGDVDASPVWTITGPAVSATAGIVGGPSWSIGAVGSGETITIDLRRPPDGPSVHDQTGAPRWPIIDWPSSTLWQLPAAEVMVEIQLIGGEPGTSGIRLEYRPRWETS